MSRERPTIHKGLALLECDSRATLEEMMRHLEELGLHSRRVGARGLAFPASEVPQVVRALRSQQCFPRIVGSGAEDSGKEDA
jgi:hypothetical protein